MRVFKTVLLFILAVSPFSQASAQKSKAAMTTEINANLPNNVTGAITPAILRSTLIDMVNSYLDLNGSASELCPAGQYVTGFSSLSVPQCGTGVGALTTTNDTNVTLSLGGTPTTALFNAVSITAGWTGTLSLARGGLGGSQFAATANQVPVFPGGGAAAVPTSPSSWFDAAYCNTAGYLIARTTGAWTCSGNIPVNARWLGATGNGTTDDTTALQNAINAAEAAHSSVYIPAGQYVISTNLSITSRITIFGDGMQGAGANCFVPSGCSNLSAAQMARATTILPSNTIDGIYVNTSDPGVKIHDLQVGYTTQPTALSGISAIVVRPSTATVIGDVAIYDVMVAGADRGINVLDCEHCKFHHISFFNEVSYSFFIDNTPAVTNAEDNELSDSVFISGSAHTLTHVYYYGGGGWRIRGNKIDTGGSINATTGIEINPQETNASVEPTIIVGNTIEGNNIGIHYTGPGSGVTATQGVITGNQIWAGNNATLGTKGIAIEIDSGSQWVSGLTVSGNFLNIDGAAACGSSCPIVVIGNSAASSVNFSGNILNVATGTGQAFSFGTGLTNIKTSGNMAGSGVTIGANSMGTLTCGSPLTNNNANMVHGTLYGGTGVTAVAINGTGQYSQTSAALPISGWNLNPNDTITVTCSGAPTNTWTALNP